MRAAMTKAFVCMIFNWITFAENMHIRTPSSLYSSEALLLSFHVIQERPEEFGSQLTGRLLAHQDNLGVAVFWRTQNDTSSTTPAPCVAGAGPEDPYKEFWKATRAGSWQSR